MSEVCVRVAVRLRPLLPKEVLHNHKVCLRVVPGTARVMLGSDRLFSFDHAFGPVASQNEVYESCVQPLVESLVDGYNATVFCYGQTGSGKTYTLGGGKLEVEGGIIDCVARDVFLLLGEKRKSNDGVEAKFQVSYLELYKEELRDLLELPAVQKEIHIREDDKGNTVVVGAKKMVVTSAEELLSILEMANVLRHTGNTGMNEHSSRSHTMLTLQITQCCHNSSSVRFSKLCLVDLAGSECARKTGNTGTRLKESAHINTDLLALGNVIRALSDPGRNLHGSHYSRAHVPYRDAKITRLLRDSLGGTAHTLMVACVSPSHHSVAETLSVLQFASKARHIRNQPGTASCPAEVKSCRKTWDPGEARLEELDYEVQTLRDLLKEKEREIEKETEKTGGGFRGGDSFKLCSRTRVSETDMEVSQEEPSQCCLLVQEAAALLAIFGPSPSQSFQQRLQDWKEKAGEHSHQTADQNFSGKRNQPHEVTILEFRQELQKCQEALIIKEQLLEQKDAKLTQVENEVEELLQERKKHLTALDEQKERNRVQTEQLVDQQVLIDRLRSDQMAVRAASSGAKVEAGSSGNFDKRPHSVPLITHRCGHGRSRKIHSSPPAYSLERLIAAFKMRGHLLLAESDEKDRVYCPFISQQKESSDGDQEEEEDDFVGRMGFRRSLNLTWTCRQKKSALREKKTAMEQTSNEMQQPQQATGAIDHLVKQCHVRNARQRASVTQRRIQVLSVNMSLKEELIKDLDKTDKETLAVGRHCRHSSDGKEAGVLARLSMQSKQSRAELYRSLQHMRRERAQLQSSLIPKTSNSTKESDHDGERILEVLSVCKSKLQEDSEETGRDSCWLEDVEEQVLKRRAELEELEEELRRRKEVLLHRGACLQQKNKLEIKRLRSSQALSQDLLRVSVRLESLDEQLESCGNVTHTNGLTTEDLKKERDLLIKRRDSLDAQLKDNRVLTVEDDHSLLQLEEAIEALDAALEYKNHSIQDKQKSLSITDSPACQLQNPESTYLCNIIRKLRELSPPETSDLLVKYFNKVVCLREAERHLRLRYGELELYTGEQEVALREMEATMQRLALDADRRLTQQQRDHQDNIQLLLQKLKEGSSGDTQQAIKDRLQNLEKELFFYKSSSRQLKKKLKELNTLHSVDQPLHTQTPHIKIHMSANEPQMHTEEAQTRSYIATTYTKIQAERKDKQTHNDAHIERHQTLCPSLSMELQAHNKAKMPADIHIHALAQSQGKDGRGAHHYGESLEISSGRVCRRELRPSSLADLQVPVTDTRRRPSVVDTSSESIFEDSIELQRNTDR